MSIFNEDTLGEEIKRQWGEHGAHYQVYKEVLLHAKHSINEDKQSQCCECVDSSIIKSDNGTYWCKKCGLFPVISAY